MAKKTVLKKLLKDWGILSAEMQMAMDGDMSVIDKNSFTYADNSGETVPKMPATDFEQIEETTSEDVVDEETGEILLEADSAINPAK